MTITIPVWLCVAGKWLLLTAGGLVLLLLIFCTGMLFHVLNALFPGKRGH